MRVRRLRVIDPADAIGLGHGDHAVGAEGMIAQPGRDRLSRHVDGAGQAGGGQGVGHLVGGGSAAVDAGGDRDVPDGCEFGRRGVPLRDERTVDEQVLDHTELAGTGHAGGEADRLRPLDDIGVLDHVQGHIVGAVVDAGELGIVIDLRLIGRIGLGAAVPIEVVGGDVEHGRGIGAHRLLPVQLEAREFDREHLESRLEHGLEQRRADVAAGLGPEPGGQQHRFEHRRGRRLAVGAGDRQPFRVVGAPDPPGQFDLADDGDAGRGGRGEHGLIRPPAG